MWKEFTFFGEALRTVPSPEIDHPGYPLFCLSQVEVGDRVRIIEFRHPQSMDCWFSLGCVLDAELQIISRSSSGSVIAVLHGKQIGIGAAIAHSIVVSKLELAVDHAQQCPLDLDRH